MSAKVISFVNQKGGCGKTTSSVNVAATLASMGYKVELVNLDPQGTAIDWAESRANADKAATFRVSSMGLNVRKELGAAKESNDFIIIDGAPQASNLTIAAMKVSDLVIIPLQATQADAWSTDSTIDFVDQLHEMAEREHPKAMLLPTRILKSSREARTFSDSLKKGYADMEFPPQVMKSRTTQLVDYQRVFEGGGSVLDLDEEQQARFEIKMLAKEIIKVTGAL